MVTVRYTGLDISFNKGERKVGSQSVVVLLVGYIFLCFYTYR